MQYLSFNSLPFAGEVPNTWWVIQAILVILLIGTLVRAVTLRGAPPDEAKNRLNSLRSWWIVTIVITASAALGSTVACVVFAVISLLALHEFQRLAKSDPPRIVKWLSIVIVSVSYLLLGLGFTSGFLAFLPIAAVIAVSMGMVAGSRTVGFLKSVTSTSWGLLVTAYLLGFTILLFRLPNPHNTAATGGEWFLLLILLTESNDIMQALVGRRIGHRKLAPIVSPHKTWEGLIGGITSTVLLASLLAPCLTSLTLLQAAASGALISIAGLFGDLNISALKRDAGVKDSGNLLPGQGGILDRIDSLTFTAPTFYYFAVIMIQ